MKIKKNVTVYVCEYCMIKKLFRRQAMIRHEEYCTNNPENNSLCFTCIHHKLTTKEIKGNYGDVGCDNDIRIVDAHRCNKLDKHIYPPSVERKGLIKKYPEMFVNSMKMPYSCDYYQHLNIY